MQCQRTLLLRQSSTRFSLAVSNYTNRAGFTPSSSSSSHVYSKPKGKSTARGLSSPEIKRLVPLTPKSTDHDTIRLSSNDIKDVAGGLAKGYYSPYYDRSAASTYNFGRQRRFFARWRPFIKPINGSIAEAKYGKDKQDKRVAETLQQTGLEDTQREQKEKEDRDKQMELMYTRKTALLGNTPYMSLRYVQAFHAGKQAAAQQMTSSSEDPLQGQQPDQELLTEPILLRLRLDVDLTREAVRGTCVLPFGLQTKTRLLAFCPDHQAAEMRQLGADFAGITDLIKRIEKGWLGFDRCIATQDIMKRVLPVAKILGPKRLMPSPRSGTVVEDLRSAIKETKGGGLIEYRAEQSKDEHNKCEVEITVGDTTFANQMVLDNVKFFVAHLLKNRMKIGNKITKIGGNGSGTGGTNMIKDVRKNDGASAGKKTSALYITRAHIKTATGPIVILKPEDVLPSSSGYFR
ncbi:unnamed protein product [Amoebophrya sp. A120]|nr:unnamed protein product [Amoebophrya sp. A120]|eukprot:GSA120T00006153001.1